MRRTGLIAAAAILLIPLAASRPAGAQDDSGLPQILDAQGRPAENSIVQLQKLNLGGVGQWILIRGRDRSNPVLLVLHGGPGEAMMPWVDLLQPSELEDSFIVVHWDQRGAGKSFSPALPKEALDIDAYVDDTLELADLLRRRFGQERIFLTGTSWGSMLGFEVLERNPDFFRAFIATSERVDWSRSQQLGFDWARTEAEARGDQTALEKIAAIEPFDPADPADVAAKDALLERFNGGDFHTEGRRQGFLDYLASGQSPYYTPNEVKVFDKAVAFSRKTVQPQTRDYNLFEDYPKSEIPVHFISGAEDRQTPVELVEEYAAALDAPDKSLTIVQNTGHNVPFDAPRAWAAALIRIAQETMARTE